MSSTEKTQVQAPGVAWWIPAYLTNLVRKARIHIVPVSISPARHPRINVEATERLFSRLRENPHTRFVITSHSVNCGSSDD